MKYNIIYADPAWSFKTYSDKGKEKKSAENHYPCMKIDDIYNLPVSNIAEKDCILFLWVTNPLLKEGLKTIEKWGFTYKTIAFVWVKKNKKADTPFWGLGYWSRANVELCLLATKGKPQRVDKGVHQIIETFEDFETETIVSPIRKHSQKPEEVRLKIIKLCGDLPRIELFAREQKEGFDVWGNEVENSIDIKLNLVK